MVRKIILPLREYFNDTMIMRRSANRIFSKLKSHNIRNIIEPISFLLVFFLIFGLLAHRMGLSNMLNTIMQTAYKLLIDTVLFLMGITVLSGALGKLLVEFGVVRMLEKLLRPFIKPIFGLPGVAALGAIITFLSDNPAIISLAKDKQFGQYFRKYQLVSLTNFGTAFGMGLIVIVFMISLGYGKGAMVGLLGAIVGCVISTRMMQYLTLRIYPNFKIENAYPEDIHEDTKTISSKDSIFIRALNAILDGGKVGVDLGLAIIPGVLVISTAVMMMTFGPSGDDGSYIGAAYEGVPLLPYLAEKLDWLFELLFGFRHPELISFPITALGAVGAALGLLPEFGTRGMLDTNTIAVFTAIGMCWSGYLSTHTAMLDTLGYRKLTGKAIFAHTIGGLCAGIFAHLLCLIFF